MISNPQKASPPPAVSQPAAVTHFLHAITSGQHWYLALLEAINHWQLAEEDYGGRHYRYLVGDEAFDWLLLAERLCEAANGLIPEPEVLDLLFHGIAPLDIPPQEFRRLIGPAKYRAHLNFVYGVTLEETLQQAVEEEVRKERRMRGLAGERRILDEVFPRIYGATQPELLDRFRDEKELPDTDHISLAELREFTYWLFKYRLTHCDPAKVASDTRKAMMELGRMRAAALAPEGGSNYEAID